VLPHFRERKSGTNVFISSISGWSGMEFNAGYSGTKFALEGKVFTRNTPMRKYEASITHMHEQEWSKV
jgi:NADP-dependent 3-hydroxy acid dehydrogenase YdfG